MDYTTVKQIISCFETGKKQGAYDTVTVLRDGAGISYGSHQSTDGSDSTDRIVYRYIDLGGVHAACLRPYLDELSSDLSTKVDPSNLPQWVRDLMGILKLAGQDPIMVRAQEEIFDADYFQPALAQWREMGLTTPLALAVVYDTCIHSGPGGVARIRKLFPEVPPSRGGDERAWVAAYVVARRKWLAGSSNALVQKTVYRMDTFLKLIHDSNWDLTKPFTTQGVRFNG